jgi:hypothetical protein
MPASWSDPQLLEAAEPPVLDLNDAHRFLTVGSIMTAVEHACCC